jgi:hypothetical protein
MPAGSTLEPENVVFYCEIVAGHLGGYEFVFEPIAANDLIVRPVVTARDRQSTGRTVICWRL